MPQCRNNTLPGPSTLGIPPDMSVGMVPSTNATRGAMETCCAPNAVHDTDDGCTLWCELPDSIVREGRGGRVHLSDPFSACLTRANPNVANEVDIIGAFSGCMPTSQPMSLGGLGVVVLLILGLVNRV